VTAARGRTDESGYRRRNLVPAAILVAVLALASVVTWIVVFSSSTASSVTSCNPSPVPSAGTVQSATALDGRPAAAPGDVRVSVLNAAGQRGQAQLAAVELGELGIQEGRPPDNDRLYPAQDLTCVGQIRYGSAGAAAARTMSLVLPCAELVQDGRGDPGVDLALGSDFREIDPPQPVTDALRALSRASAADDPALAPDTTALDGLRGVDCSS
jgi:hypothetical protein